jgi:hypothetical protein
VALTSAHLIIAAAIVRLRDMQNPKTHPQAMSDFGA